MMVRKEDREAKLVKKCKRCRHWKSQHTKKGIGACAVKIGIGLCDCGGWK